jgi:pyruvate/2-oxoglutarate dehydrogenase complex dihydrolipoamide acyltransferase (E2) component
MDNSPAYETAPFPAERRLVVDAGRMGSRRHLTHALLELDISRPRTAIDQHLAATGEKLSFTGFIAACLGQALQQHPQANAYRNWRGRLVIFHEVDVVVMIETKVDKVALPHIIRAANRKSPRQIHDEIRSVQTRPAHSRQGQFIARWGLRAPRLVRDLFWWFLRVNPHRLKAFSGTTIITSVGMLGRGGGWGLGFLPVHTLGLTLGGIAERPAWVDGRVEPREFLNLTISFDHDIVDGAPAARFSHDLRQLVESGYGLEVQ